MLSHDAGKGRIPSAGAPGYPSTAMTTCPSCGAQAAGNFCNACGSALTARQCPACQASLSPKARFCHRCGTTIGSTARPGEAVASDRLPWIVAGTATVILIGGIIFTVARKAPEPAVPQMANPGAATTAGAGAVPSGPAPDISQMSPRERFARLNDRIMQAAQNGDSATVVRFMPMALGAYAQLDTFDTDARYHAATLHAQVGDFAAALALADTIDTGSPHNLLATIIRADVAQAQGNQQAARKAEADFLQHWDAEIAKNRQEYVDHRPLLDQFRNQAGKP